jgi:glycerol uptake facilitator protein
MVVLFPSKNPGETIHGGFTNITLGWGLAVTMGIYIAGKVSGAHLNPAVTLALAVFRNFSWSKVLPYSIAQTAGAFVGCGAGLLELPARLSPVRSAIGSHCRSLYHVPRFSRRRRRQAFSISSSGRDCCASHLCDHRRIQHAAGSESCARMIGLVVVAIGMSFGGMHGYAINPARDFGPRLFTVVAGFRNNGLTDGTHVWWIPIVAPLLGGLAGATRSIRSLGSGDFCKPS